MVGNAAGRLYSLVHGRQVSASQAGPVSQRLPSPVTDTALARIVEMSIAMQGVPFVTYRDLRSCHNFLYQIATELPNVRGWFAIGYVMGAVQSPTIAMYLLQE